MKISRKLNGIFYFVLTALVCPAFFSCKKKQPEVSFEAPALEIKKSNHNWFYFTKDNFVAIDKIQNVPACKPTPWTEAARISSANNKADSEELICKAFAIVNRIGVLSFENDKISLSKDENLFSDRTAGNLVFMNNTPVFSVYKSAFFNNSIKDPLYKSDTSQHLFLMQFDEKTKITYPIINCNNLTDELNSEVTDFYWDGLNWTCSIKTISDVKNSFSYVRWKPTVSLLDLSPNSAKDNISVSEIVQDDFRNARVQNDYNNAPDRIKKLLANFSEQVPFYIEVKSSGGTSPRDYVNFIPDCAEKELSAKAIISQSWSAVLFEDGTLFLEGALPGKHILRGGKPVAIRLPKLPAGFVYSDFVISDTTLYAAWEETNFYMTSRSGFLQVDLDKSLYSKLL